MAYPSLLRIAKPRSFLYLMSLRTGTTFITLTILINKVSGLYGILALLTGLPLNSLQLSMYIYSIFALVLTATLFPHIRKQSPLQCLALAWFYVVDSVVNVAYTVVFGAAWFMVVAQHTTPGGSGSGSGSGKVGGAAGTIGDHAGFTDPKFPDVTSVDVLAPTGMPDSSSSRSGAQLMANTGSTHAAADASGAALGATMFQSGSIASISVISGLWAIRIYFIFVILAYARCILRQYIVHSSYTSGLSQSLAGSSTDGGKFAENPFAEGKELGAGWRGKLGRLMVSIGKGYWLGADEAGDVEWNRGFPRGANGKAGEGKPPTLERERRRRAGTGPTLRPIELENVRKA